jgi:hypothetical protein
MAQSQHFFGEKEARILAKAAAKNSQKLYLLKK